MELKSATQSAPNLATVSNYFYYDPTKPTNPVTNFSLTQAAIPTSAIWLNFTGCDPDLENFLAQDLRLPVNAIKSLCNPAVKTRSWKKPGAIFFSLCGFATTVNQAQTEMVALNFYLTEKQLITVSTQPALNYQDLMSELMLNTITTEQGIAIEIIAHLFYQIETVIATMQQQLFDLEAQISSKSFKYSSHTLWQVRKSIISYIHNFHMQEDMIEQLYYEKSNLLENIDLDYFKTITNNIAHCTSALHAAENTAIALQDKVDNLAADAMNRKVYLLSILALFIVPLNLLGSLLGMNVPIPGQNYHYAFEIVLALGFGIAIGLYIFFRIKKWLS